MANRVRGHSGMENTDVPSINKEVAITAPTLKMEKAFLHLLNVPHPSLGDANFTYIRYKRRFGRRDPTINNQKFQKTNKKGK